MTNDFVVRDLRASLGQATILVVEDEIITRAALCERLRQQGYKVFEAGTADEAVSILRSGTLADVVITDLETPGSLDGGDLVRLIRTEFTWLKVVMVSGHSPGSDIRSLLDGYLPKPVLPSELVRYLQATIPLAADGEAS